MKPIPLSQLIFPCNSAKDGNLEVSNTDMHDGKNKLECKLQNRFSEKYFVKNSLSKIWII